MTITVVSTGGTIAMCLDPVTGELLPAVSGQELAESMAWPEAPPLDVDQFTNTPSLDIHGEVAAGLARRVVEHAARAGDGIVVMHGTDTMEETVYLIDLVLPAGSVPVVLTGAQRTAADADADGPRNLRDAIRLAMAPEARGLGAVVCFAGEIHAAREVARSTPPRWHRSPRRAPARSAMSGSAVSRCGAARRRASRCRCRRRRCRGWT